MRLIGRGGLPKLGMGISTAMELSILLIIIGIVLAVFVHYALGIVCILIGLVLLIWPRITAAADAFSRQNGDTRRR